MMKDPTKKTPVEMPPDFPELAGATLKDECYQMPEEGTAAAKQLDTDLKAFWEAKKAGRIPQYPCFSLKD